MHNNYYFLRQVSLALEHELKGCTLVSCFSQAKDELVIEFNNGTRSVFIRAILQADFGCLTFPMKFHRARKNSVDLFNVLLMKEVSGVRQFSNERSLAIAFGEWSLLFKMHGTRANVLLMENNKVEAMFRSNLVADLDLDVSQLDREIDWSKDEFMSRRHEIKKVYFTFGSAVWRHLEEKGFGQADPDTQWLMINQLRTQLGSPDFFIVESENKIALTLFPAGNVRQTFTNPLHAATAFAQRYASEGAFAKEKNMLIRYWTDKAAGATAYLAKISERLKEIGKQEYKLMGDLLMANLHIVKPGNDKLRVANFSGDGETEISLDPRISPQSNAERYYRKSKNQQIEVKKLAELYALKSNELAEANQALVQANSLADLAEVRKATPVATSKRQEAAALPYREHEFNGYRIWVGKDARNNDELTLKYATKEDLWLHARDVAGSHVVIKHAGKPFPKPVIERAAQLAAFHSKRKTESLCPVIVTPKKFVRKRKGDPAGVVVVEREEVVMVEPKA